jgi:drug/metabolite transporter (DMT)-like permease
MLLVGTLSAVLNFAALAALQLTSATNVATLARADVLFSLLLAVLIFHEAVDRVAWLATPLMLGGIALMTGVLVAPLGIGNIGDGLVLFSAFLVAFNAYIVRYAARRTDPSLVGFINTLVCSIAFLTATLVMPSPGGELLGLAAAFAHPLALTLGLLVALFLAGYCMALRELPVWKVRLLMLLIPVVAAVAGVAWIGEHVSHVKVVGMILVCGGAAGVLAAKRLPPASRRTTQRRPSVA